MLSINSIRQFISAHPRKAAVIAVAVILYAVLNVWVYRWVTSDRRAPKNYQGLTLPKQGETFSDSKSATPRPTPTPTPRPTGPGVYACSPEAACNLYSDAVRQQYCTTTYADSLCLDQCGDAAKRCSK